MRRRLLDVAARTRWVLLTSALALTLLPIMVIDNGGSAARAITGLLALLLVLVIFLVGVNLSGRDPDAENIAAAVVSDALTQRLLVRWLRRSKHFRFVGGLAGLILSMAFVNDGLGPAIAGLLGGISVGGAAAEIHGAGRPTGTRRRADMTVRHVSDYVTKTDTTALALLSAASLAMIVWGALSEHHAAATLLRAGLAVLAIVAMTAVMQRMIVTRRRPALSPDVRRADDLIRRLGATQGFTRPAIAFAFLVTVRGVTAFDNSGATTAIAGLLGVLAFAWYVSSRQSRSNLMALSRS